MNKLRILAVFFGLFLLQYSAQSQDEVIYMHYVQNPVVTNVGATGFRDEHRILANFRNQWSGFDGAPRNYLLSYHTGILDNMGVGGLISLENLGAVSRFRVRGSYAYKLHIEGGKIGLGLGVDVQTENLSKNAKESNLVDLEDPYLQELDNGLAYFDVDFGAYSELDNGLVLGFNASDLIRARIDNDILGIEDSTSTFLRNVGFYGGYDIDIDGAPLSIFPSVYARKTFTYPWQVDLGLLFKFLDDQLSAGLSYGFGGYKRVGFLMGLGLDKLHINYSYDISTREFQTYSGGAHEVSLRFSIPHSSGTKVNKGEEEFEEME